MKSEDHTLKSGIVGTSLLVQWLRLWAFSTGGTGSIPGLRTKIPHVVWRGQKKIFIVVFWLSKTDLSLLELHTEIFMNEMICSLSVLQKCPTGVEAVVKKKQERPWVNCCSWVTDTWGLSHCSLLFHTGLIFSITTKKKKKIFKIQVEAIPNREENMVKAKKVSGSSLQARKSQQQRVLEHPHSSLSRRWGVCSQRWGWEPGRAIPRYDLLAGEWT